jgi:phage-related protein
VLEIVEDHKGDTFRVVYTVRFERAIYVLHCFQKKITLWNQNSKHGRGVNPRTFEVGHI